jgi:hypothetical protein
VKTIWLEGLRDQEREERKVLIKGSKKTLDILSKICYNMYREAEESSLADYDSPSWAYRQAHINGLKEAYGKIKEIVTLSDND